MKRDSTIEQLIPLDGRYGPKPSIELLADKYRGEAAHVAEQLGPWVDHLAREGELSPPQKHLLSELAHISLLREALLTELAKGGVVNKKGEASPLLSSVRMHIETGIKITRELMGTVTAPRPGDNGGEDVAKLWERALSAQASPDIDSTAEAAGQGVGSGAPAEAENNGSLDIKTTQDSETEEGGSE